ncbi:hypothetical protein Hanom_Chr16g01465541 [Helianthus anomalus]
MSWLGSIAYQIRKFGSAYCLGQPRSTGQSWSNLSFGSVLVRVLAWSKAVNDKTTRFRFRVSRLGQTESTLSTQRVDLVNLFSASTREF